MPFSRSGLIFRCLLVALLFTASAWADSVQTFVMCNPNGLTEIDGTPATGATCSTANGSNQIFATATVAPGGNALSSTLIQGVNFGNNFFNFDARAVSDYNVTVSGPAAGFVFVPIDIEGTGSASVTSANAGAVASIGVSGNGLAACAGRDVSRSCKANSFGGVFEHDAGVVNGVGTFTIDMTTDTFVDSSAVGSASASLDPFVFIDPAFLANNPGYSLSFSDGVDNEPPSSPTPEPSTFVLFGSSILGTAGALRRRLKR